MKPRPWFHSRTDKRIVKQRNRQKRNIALLKVKVNSYSVFLPENPKKENEE